MPAIYERLHRMQEGGGTSWGGGVTRGLNRLRTSIGPQPVVPGEGLDDILSLLGIDSAGGLGSSSGSSLATPPVLDLLAEMRARRQAEAEQARGLAEILAANVPRGMKFYPGWEPGGVADILLGIVTGEGANHGVLPADQRTVKRQQIPIPQGQPSVQEDFGDASSMANAILNAIRVIQTSSSGP